jgi:hypothetical protein
MAGRGGSGAGVGVLVTITVLGLLSLGLFVSTIVFYSNMQKAQADLAQAEQGLSEFVNAQERQDPRIAQLADTARAQRQTVVGYLLSNLERAVGSITSRAPRATADAALERLDAVQLEGVARSTGWSGQGQPPSVRQLVSGSSFEELLRRVDSGVNLITSRLAAAERAKEVAENDLRNEQERSQARDAQHRQTLAAINDELARYRAELEQYQTGINRHRDDMDARVAGLRQSTEDREAELLDRIASLEDQRLDLLDQIERLRGERKTDLFEGRPEESLVDGRVVASDPAEGTATIDLGSRDKIRIGMTFAVYEEASAIRPDAEGGYPRGKASLEVIRINETSAVCRIVAERAGNPVVRGDVIANAVYDPRKVYKFLVVGNFDTNRDGTPTEAERTGIVAMINAWGGEVVDELSGDVDFLVMGSRPVLPPAPSIDAPIPVVEQYVEAQQVIARYDELFQQAAATSLPVLNENRLRTLIGGF